MIRWSPVAPPRPGCPHRRLRRLLARALPDGIILGASTLRPWASANFVGARHLFPADALWGDAVQLRPALQQRLNAILWSLPGNIVADIAVECGGDAGGLRIEILTVED